ncbi:MAG TPA: DUF4214 domain-containing protein [Pirellulales bacterium]
MMTRRTGGDSTVARENGSFRRSRAAPNAAFRKRRRFEWLETRVLLSATPTSIAVSASPSAAVYGQPVTLTATVSGPLSAPSEGTVVFFDNGTPLATAQVSSGTAAVENVRLPAGADLITASYVDPSGNFASSSTEVGPHSTIETVAGGVLPNDLPAVDASISPRAVAVNSSGDLFIADDTLNVVFEVNHATGIVTTVAGNGTAGFSGDGGPATVAELSGPQAIAVDSSGHLFIADQYNNRIREVDLATGVITTVAGDGQGYGSFGGDGGSAIDADISGPAGVAVDSSGDLFIADWGNDRIREVNRATGIITTVAGNGTAGFGGDGGQATAAELQMPAGIALDSLGDLFILDFGNNRIREVNHATGVITTVAGNGGLNFSGDGGLATDAQLNLPKGIAVDSSGDVFIASFFGARIREVDHTTGIITTVAGNGTSGFRGDGSPATMAELFFPTSVAVDSLGDLFIADNGNNRIREVDYATRVIGTVAGNGTLDFSGDGGPAAAAEIAWPQAVAVDSSGDLFIADALNSRVREISHATGVIATVAGCGTAGFSGDDGTATAAQLNAPQGVTVNSSGDLFIADSGNNRIREVNLATGIITTVAGNGSQGFSGDGGQATAAQLTYPEGIAVDSSGHLFIADALNNRIREVNLATGIIATVAGNGTGGFSGDGGPATAAELDLPDGIAVDSSGDLFIADPNNRRVREVDLATRVITTVAGSGTQGYTGDGGPATAAELDPPTGVGVDSSGDLFIADPNNDCIREVNHATGVITTVAGTGTQGFGGEGGPASAAELARPQSVAVDSSGDLFIADQSNNRIREVRSGAAMVNVTANTSIPFVVNNAVYTIGSGVVSVSAADGLLQNDTGPTQLAVAAGTEARAEGGTFAFNSDGSFTFTPPANFSGYASAPFTVTDASGDKATHTVTVLSQHASVVWKFYEQVLNRAPDPGGLQYWTNYLDNGGQTGQMALGFFESTELLDNIIGNDYQEYLLRMPDAAGLAYWVGVWHATGGPEQIKAGFADSPEFYHSAGGTPQTWIAALYQRILDRSPDPSGEAFWLNHYQQQVAAGVDTGAVRQQIALGFFDSPEAYGQDVAGWFQEYLLRAPTNAEKAHYVSQMEAGATDRTIEQEITNLPEYAGNPPTPGEGMASPLPDYYQTPASGVSAQRVVAAKDALFSQL